MTENTALTLKTEPKTEILFLYLLPSPHIRTKLPLPAPLQFLTEESLNCCKKKKIMIPVRTFLNTRKLNTPEKEHYRERSLQSFKFQDN